MPLVFHARRKAHFCSVLALLLMCALTAVAQPSSLQQLSALATLDQAMSGKKPSLNAILPRWFEEGLAMMVADTAVPEQKNEDEGRFQKVLQHGALLSLNQESDGELFQTLTELFTLGRSQADTYAQSWSMTECLVSILAPQKVTPFLEEVRATRSFNKAALKFTSLSPQEFYDRWRGQVSR